MKNTQFDPGKLSEIIELALLGHASFGQIRALHGLSPAEVKALVHR